MTEAVKAPKKNRGRSALSGIILVIAVLLTPFAVVTNWATIQVNDTQEFVDTLGPLASDPAVQNLIIDEVTNRIDDAVNLKETTSSLIGGLGDALNLPPVAKDALGLVSDPLAAGVKSLLHDAVSNVVKSDGFKDAWIKTLTITQEQVVALLEGKETGVLSMTSDGTITMNLKPVIAEVKQSLVNNGMGFAKAIPDLDLKIEVGKVPQLAVARVIYQIGVGVGTWLPWIVMGLYLLGIAFAVRRARAIRNTAIFVVLESILMLVIFSVSRLLVVNSVGDAYRVAVGVVYDAVAAYVVSVVVALTVLSVFLAIAAWIASSSEDSPLRRWFAHLFAWLRSKLDAVGITMGQAGPVLYRIRIGVRIAVVAIAGLIVAFIRPINVTSVIVATVIVLVVLFIYELLQRVPVTRGSGRRAAVSQSPAKRPSPARRRTPAKRS